MNQNLNTNEKEHRITIPKYSLPEEMISSISHGVGALLGITALILCVVKSVLYGETIEIVSSSIYGATLILLYTMSTIYHALKINAAKRVFRVIDHCSIFLLIAGTYTPYTLIAMKGSVGLILFGLVWTSAIVGITLNAIDIKKFKKFSMICYIASGWVIIFAFKPLTQTLAASGIVLLILGGVIYTIGAALYGIGGKVKYMHSIWHFFVLGGSILHFFSIFLYVL